MRLASPVRLASSIRPAPKRDAKLPDAAAPSPPHPPSQKTAVFEAAASFRTASAATASTACVGEFGWGYEHHCQADYDRQRPKSDLAFHCFPPFMRAAEPRCCGIRPA